MNISYRLIGATLVVVAAGALSGCNQNESSQRQADVKAVEPPKTATGQNTVTRTDAPAVNCKADASWVSNPNPPDEIPGGGETFCQFYQFSWQWFLYLMSPSDAQQGQRNFENTRDFPVLQVDEDSCSSTPSEPQLLVRTMKQSEAGTGLVLPERIHQAGGQQAVIYDQQRNVVFYSIAFSRDFCDAPKEGNLPVPTTELKMAWKVIDDAQKDDYVWMEADIIPDNGDTKDGGLKETLGLVGLHLVRGTREHPELVWASFEHKENVPHCQDPAPAPDGGWSFLSAVCENRLKSPASQVAADCNFNKGSGVDKITGGTPSEICRVFPRGTAPGDHKAGTNIADIKSLNKQLVGPGGIIDSLSADNSMKVLSNYFNIGALWVSDPKSPATEQNQRGSLQLANTVMETTYQGTLEFTASEVKTSTDGVKNCFDCHNYQPGKTATTGLSHIFGTVKKQQGH